MKKRLRKKRKLGEFREEAFVYSCIFSEESKDSNIHIDSFLNFIESLNIGTWSFHGPTRWVGTCASLKKRTQIPDEKKERIRNYLEKLPNCTGVIIGSNFDMNHTSEEEQDSLFKEHLCYKD